MPNSYRLPKLFLIGYTIFLLVGFVFLFILQKGDLNLYFMCHRSPFLDSYFALSSSLAEGLFLTLIGLIVLLKDPKHILLYLAMLITMSGIVNFLKKVVFQTARPALYFHDYIQVETVSGIELMKHYSFPSGHTTAAFSVFFLLSFLFPNKGFQVLFFLAALSCGISRVYLQQHFFVDVYAGSILGITISWSLYWLWNHFSVSQKLEVFNKKSNA